MAKKKQYTFIDLFAGAGGLSEGFIRAGFEPIAHIEMKKEACDTLRTRAAYHYLRKNDQLNVYKDYLIHKQEKEDGSKLWNKVPKEVTDAIIQSEIGEKTIAGIFEKLDHLIGEKELDLIIGGPPCQAYSVAGRARKGEAMAKDPRNELYKFYVQFLDRYKPKMFVFENVLGIRTAKGGEPFRDLQKRVRELDNCNYEIEAVPQIASDFGVLQRRQRMIIIGWRKTDNGKPTKYAHYPNLEEFKIDNQFQTLRDLFSDLPTRIAGDGKLCECVEYTKPISEMTYLQEYGLRNNDFDFTTQHVSRPNNLNDREIYCWAVKKFLNEGKQLSYSKDVPPDHQKHKNKETFDNRFSVVNPYGVCHTVVAHIAMDGHYYIYPTLNPTVDNVRSITIREAARIQSFPDDYYFEGSRSAAFMQIGNAVPVIMAQKIAEAILKQLTQ